MIAGAISRMPIGRLLLIISVCCFFVVNTFAQLHWQNADSLYKPLPPSVHLFKSVDSLDGFPITAFFVSAKLNNRQLSFSAHTVPMQLLTPSQYYQQEGFPLITMNCGFFSLDTRQNVSVIINNGKLVSFNITSLRGAGKDSALYYYTSRSAIGISKSHKADVAWIFTDSSQKYPYAFESGPVLAKGKKALPKISDLDNVDWKWWKMQTAIGGGPVLVHDGVVRITNKEEQNVAGKFNERDARTAMGYTIDGRLIILVIQGKELTATAGVTLSEEAAILKSIGCYEALNINSGVNSCLLVNGKETILPSAVSGQHPVPAVFMIKFNQKMKK